MSRISMIAISLPEDILAAVEAERKLTGESRSEFFRRAADVLLKQRWERMTAKEYMRCYREIPESEKRLKQLTLREAPYWPRSRGVKRGDLW